MKPIPRLLIGIIPDLAPLTITVRIMLDSNDGVVLSGRERLKPAVQVITIIGVQTTEVLMLLALHSRSTSFLLQAETRKGPYLLVKLGGVRNRWNEGGRLLCRETHKWLDKVEGMARR